MEAAQKKGMSKGCLVALIIVAAVVVLVAIGMGTCWYYKDDLMKMAATTAINELKTKIAEAPPEGVDTVYFNALADGFSAKMKDDDKIDMVKYSGLIQTLQDAARGAALDADMVEQVERGMTSYYPELEEIQKAESSEEMENDTLLPEDEAVDTE